MIISTATQQRHDEKPFRATAFTLDKEKLKVVTCWAGSHPQITPLGNP